MLNPLQQLRHALIVSCQASPNDPMEDTETLRRVARSSIQGGAQGLRLNSPEDIRAVRRDTDLPIIGIQKSYRGGRLRITPDFAAAQALAAAGATIIALDCTDRVHPYGEPWREVLCRIHQELDLLVMADIATLREGVEAADAGADLIGTTLCGYTEDTAAEHEFSWPLLRNLVRETGRAVVAEGHIATPAEAVRTLEEGAWCVVVGSAITRPGVLTTRFLRALDQARPTTREARQVLAIDLGGTSIKSALVNEHGELTFVGRTPTVVTGGRETIARSMRDAIAQRLHDAEAAGIALIGVGIASAGAIDASQGLVFAATENLPGWTGFDFRANLRDLTALPVYVENDAHAAALAELYFGAGHGLSSFIALTLGTGVGGGIILGGKLQRGRFGFAGTVGHQTIRFDGRLCNCGRRGCLEAYVSTEALVRTYAELSGEVLDETLPYADRAMQISGLAKANNAAAQEAYRTLARFLAEGIANLCNILDPEAILVSGGLIDGQPDFLTQLAIDAESLLHFGDKRRPRILHASAGHLAGVQGAAAAVFEAIPRS